MKGYEDIQSGSQLSALPGYEDIGEPEKPSALMGSIKQAGRGFLEGINPFTGEKMAEQAELPLPTSFTERLTRRAARNLPAALATAPFTGGIPSAIGYLGSVGLGTLAEELGVPESYQPVAEVAGAGIPQLGKNIIGRTMGYIQPQLQELASKAKKVGGYDIGPGAKTEQGMKYGTGDDPRASIWNLDRATKDATARAGNSIEQGKAIDGQWIQQTAKKLGDEANSIFAGHRFSADQPFLEQINSLVTRAEGAFGEQGNVVKTILNSNIRGERPQGALISGDFAAPDLRSAIVDVNARLSGAKPNEVKILSDLKDSLESLAERNFTNLNLPELSQRYNTWKSNYSSFATLRDLFLTEGNLGVTRAGQVNPSKLLDIITQRTGGNPVRNPLYENLAEYGPVLQAKKPVTQGGIKATLSELTESPLAKVLKTTLMSKVPTKESGYGLTAQTLAPLTKYFQVDSEE